MPGLSASELPPEALHAGDTIEYFSRAFVCGDHRGYRRAVVTCVDGGDDVDFPVTVSTEEPIPTDMMVKKVADCLGNPLARVKTKWRKVRTFKLVPGAVSAPTRSSALNSALQAAVAAAYEAVRGERERIPEEIVPETPPSSASSSPITQTNQSHVAPPSTPQRDSTPDPVFAGGSTVSGEYSPCEGTSGTSAVREVIDLVSPEKSSGMVSDSASAVSVQSVPNRHARAKIRHQPKTKRAQWLVPRSRKHRNLAKCAMTRSGSTIYHAKTVKAVKFSKLRNSPDIKKELEILHTKRSTYSDPVPKQRQILCKTVAWPAEIERITTCKRNGVKFPDIGSYDPCKCFGDCFWDTCTNVASASFCIPQYCKLGAICSNAPRTLSSLKLFDTGRVGLGVYTTTDLDIGDVLGEYCGELSELPAVVEGQPPQAVKTNTGYTLLYNTRSVNNNYVYVDALRCGSITRFISHSCEPNATFLEQQTRSRVRVLVKMIKNVQAGAQITVHYGNERWFRCACDLCWKEPRRTGESSGDE